MLTTHLTAVISSAATLYGEKDNSMELNREASSKQAEASTGKSSRKSNTKKKKIEIEIEEGDSESEEERKGEKVDDVKSKKEEWVL